MAEQERPVEAVVLAVESLRFTRPLGLEHFRLLLVLRESAVDRRLLTVVVAVVRFAAAKNQAVVVAPAEFLSAELCS